MMHLKYLRDFLNEAICGIHYDPKKEDAILKRYPQLYLFVQS